MFHQSKLFFFSVCIALTVFSAFPPDTSAQDLSGRDLLAVARAVHGGREFAGLQYVTASSRGFVNASAFAATDIGSLAAALGVQVGVTDYQDRNARRRLDVNSVGGLSLGPTFLVYTGTEGGGMVAGAQIRVEEVALSRHWAMMGFSTLNRAVDGQLMSTRQRDEGNTFVVEVRFSAQDTARYYIDKTSFLINRVVTRYNTEVMIEEDRTDYRRVSCMMFPFRVVTKLRGQRLADLTVDRYDLETVVPSSRFTIAASPMD